MFGMLTRRQRCVCVRARCTGDVQDCDEFDLNAMGVTGDAAKKLLSLAEAREAGFRSGTRGFGLKDLPTVWRNRNHHAPPPAPHASTTTTASATAAAAAAAAQGVIVMPFAPVIIAAPPIGLEPAHSAGAGTTAPATANVAADADSNQQPAGDSSAETSSPSHGTAPANTAPSGVATDGDGFTVEQRRLLDGIANKLAAPATLAASSSSRFAGTDLPIDSALDVSRGLARRHCGVAWDAALVNDPRDEYLALYPGKGAVANWLHKIWQGDVSNDRPAGAKPIGKRTAGGGSGGGVGRGRGDGGGKAAGKGGATAGHGKPVGASAATAAAKGGAASGAAAAKGVAAAAGAAAGDSAGSGSDGKVGLTRVMTLSVQAPQRNVSNLQVCVLELPRLPSPVPCTSGCDVGKKSVSVMQWDWGEEGLNRSLCSDRLGSCSWKPPAPHGCVVISPLACCVIRCSV